VNLCGPIGSSMTENRGSLPALPMSELLHERFDGYKSFVRPGARPHYTPDRPGQVDHIALDLVLDIAKHRAEGTCTLRIVPVRPIETLVLDGVGMTINGVKVGKTDQLFDYDGEQLTIQLKQSPKVDTAFEVTIDYRLDHPQRGLYFIGPDEHYPKRNVQVWTQGEDEDSRYWFPCLDYPGQLATSEIRVRIPKPLIAISNGELVATEMIDDDRIYHWKQQEVHPTYLMTLAIGDFAVVEDQWNGKPVNYYVAKGREADATITMGKTPRMIEFYSQTFGYAYPFPKYAQVCVDGFIFGGMENTSTTLLTDRCLLDQRAAIDNMWSETLVAHELAHQWFGDLLVIKHWSHAWIKEGMATYSETLWLNDEYSEADGAYHRLRHARNYLNEDATRYRRPIVTHIYREPIELYDCHLYEKGACVYHMIRAELGDDLFWRAIHHFVKTNAHSTVETIDLLRSIEQTTGRNLMPLFDQYVFRGGHPDYKISYSWYGEGSLAKVTIEQIQGSGTEGLFDLKLTIGFGSVTTVQSKKKAGDSAPTVAIKPITVRMNEREQSFYIPLDRKPDFISFDPGNAYLKTVDLNYPLAELKSQLTHDPDPISRIYAAIAIAKKGGLEAVNVLAKALTTESFWGVRLEIAEALASIKLDQSFEGLLPGLQDENPKVRRAVVDAIGSIKTLASYKALKPIAEKGDASYLVESAAIAALGNLVSVDGESKEKGVLKLVRSVLKDRAGWNSVVQLGAIAALQQLKTSGDALDILLETTAEGTIESLRLGAIRALGPISSGQTPPNLDRILDRLDIISRETAFLTEMTVISALGAMETAKAIGLLRGLADRTTDGRVERRAEEAIDRVQKRLGSDVAVKQLREDLDTVKKDNQQLKSRLEALEATTKATIVAAKTKAKPDSKADSKASS
jgi:aminopeptidase N